VFFIKVKFIRIEPVGVEFTKLWYEFSINYKIKFHAPYRTRYFLSLLLFILLSEGRAREKRKSYKMWRFSVSSLNLSLNSTLTVPLRL
jgi:hypothetical protein